MLGFDSAERIIAESIGAKTEAVAKNPMLRTLSQCVKDLLPSVSRACRAHGDGVVMHSLIAMAANLARDDGQEESIAEAFRVNAALLDAAPSFKGRGGLQGNNLQLDREEVARS